MSTKQHAISTVTEHKICPLHFIEQMHTAEVFLGKGSPFGQIIFEGRRTPNFSPAFFCP